MPVTRSATAPLLLASALALAVGPLAAQQQRTAEPVLITGRVVEQDGGGGIAGVRVELAEAGRVRTTDRSGFFQFLDIPPGEYTLRAEHLGYGAVEETLEAPEDARLELEIRMVPVPLEVEPVVVVVEHDRKLELAGFFHRRRAGHGDFLTRADFEAPGILEVTDALRRIGVRVTPQNQLRLRRGCRPQIFIDGLRLAQTDWSVDDILSPIDVEGVEVYRGPATPVQFTGPGGAACGSILFWTRQGRPGGTPFWKGALFTAIFLGLASLLMR